MGERATFEEALARGHDYAWSQEWERAIEEYRRAIAEFPEDPLAHSSLGLALFEAGRLREALSEYRTVKELAPDDLSAQRRVAEIYEALGRAAAAAQTWEGLAHLYEQNGEEEKALEAWREVARLHPESPQARQELAEAYTFESPEAAVQEYVALARLLWGEGKKKEAIEHCRRALALDEGNEEARGLLSQWGGKVVTPTEMEGDPVAMVARQAQARLAELILGEAKAAEVSPGGEVGLAAVGRALDFQAQGLKEEAIQEYELALREGVRSQELLFNLCALYGEVGRCEEASGHSPGLLATAEYGLPTHLLLGECYRRRGESQKALEHLLSALKVMDLSKARGDKERLSQAYDHYMRSDGEGVRHLVDLLSHFLREEGGEEKVAWLRERWEEFTPEGLAISLAEIVEHPRYEEILKALGPIQKYWENQMVLTALEECYRLLERAPDYLPLHLFLGKLFARGGKTKEAADKYAVVAEVYRGRGAAGRAVDIYRLATETAPLDMTVGKRLIELLVERGEVEEALERYMALAEARYRLAQLSEALNCYETALHLVPKSASPEAWTVRILKGKADFHLQQADWQEALATYQEAKGLAPQDEEVRRALVDLYSRLGRGQASEELDSLIQWYLERGEEAKALDLLRQMVKEKPQDIGLRRRLSEAYLAAGLKREAIAELDTLGELQLEAGLQEEAKETIRTIISLGPDDEEGYRRLLEQMGG